MLPRYVVIKFKERDEFEKQYHLPYGYSNTTIHMSLKDAVLEYNNISKAFKDSYAIEKITIEGREIIRI